MLAINILSSSDHVIVIDGLSSYEHMTMLELLSVMLRIQTA